MMPSMAHDDNSIAKDLNQVATIIQPKPQALNARQTNSSTIIVSPRQKGNPILNHVKSMPWEYGDIPADFLLGNTTCALFLQLKYHRLHPEYIYTRIRTLQGKYNLRILLVMVDIANHEDSLKELSKTSLINQITLILCWSAAEGGRYLELFKTFQNAAPTSIKQHQSVTYTDRMVDFVTKPRSVNKTDAVALVSQCGTLRTAINARHEDVAIISGWGEKKVHQWCSAVREPFRIHRANRRGDLRTETSFPLETSLPPPNIQSDPPISSEQSLVYGEEKSVEAVEADPKQIQSHDELYRSKISTPEVARADADLSEGVSAALDKLRRANHN